MNNPKYPQTPDFDRALRQAEKARQRSAVRQALLGPAGLFGDPAWDMLVELFIHQSRCGRPLAISSLSAGVSSPRSTAMKLIQRMCAAGILERTIDPLDARRSLVSIAPPLFDDLNAYFAGDRE